MARPKRGNQRRYRAWYPTRSSQPSAHRGRIHASNAREADLGQPEIGDGGAEFGGRHSFALALTAARASRHARHAGDMSPPCAVAISAMTPSTSLGSSSSGVSG